MTKKFKDLTLKQFLRNYKYNKGNEYLDRVKDGIMLAYNMLDLEKAVSIWNISRNQLVEIADLDFIIKEIC